MKYTPANRSQSVADHAAPRDAYSLIKKFESQIALALPRHMSANRMTRILLTEMRLNPQLSECTQASLLGAVIQCAQLGLEPGAGLGHIYLIPRRNKNKGVLEAHMMIGYQGMIDLAERDGRVTIDAQVVHESDDFAVEYGLEPKLFHRPCMYADHGEIVASYAIARYEDGRRKFRIVLRDEIDRARSFSDGAKSNFSPWTNHFDEMARKTAVRRLFKLIPKSIEMSRVAGLEDRDEIGESQDLHLVAEEAGIKNLPEPDQQKEQAEKAIADEQPAI